MQTTLLFAAPEPAAARPRAARSGRATADAGRAGAAAQGEFILLLDPPPPAPPCAARPARPAETAAAEIPAPPVAEPPPREPPLPPAVPMPVPRRIPANSRFIVQAFRTGARGALVAEPAILATTAAGACLRAERMAPGKAGVVAYALAGDSESGEYAEPVILARFGDAPEEML